MKYQLSVFERRCSITFKEREKLKEQLVADLGNWSSDALLEDVRIRYRSYLDLLTDEELLKEADEELLKEVGLDIPI